MFDSEGWRAVGKWWAHVTYGSVDQSPVGNENTIQEVAASCQRFSRTVSPLLELTSKQVTAARQSISKSYVI